MLALVAALLVAAGPAIAGGGEKGDWELGIYGGYGWLDDYGPYHPKNDLLYGGRFGYFFTPKWSMEVSAQRLSTETEFDILGVEDVEAHLDGYRLNALYNFGAGNRFRPFLTAGIGKEKFSLAGFGESCDLGWNAGAGFRYFMSPHWNLRADGRYVSTNVEEIDERQKNIEATLGLGFVFGGGKKSEPVEEARVEPQPQNRPPTVSCASDRPEILPGESVNIHATASDPEGDPLTYGWSTTAGRVTGTGATAMFDFTGATPPAAATVTVRVSDGHGNTVSCDNAVRLREPARAAEAVSCIAGGFPRNLSLVGNLDKACLDDVAQRLDADPRARVIIIGHADSRERPATVAERRAEAVKDYLVRERSIDGSRITTRSVGATKPLDTGTDSAAQARNRRVEVWFVPEGATVPE
jgi:outer membrane protein OmpA-like peptidoglycan-associated protein